MRKTLKALFSIVDPASRATGAAHATPSQQAPNVTPTVAATQLLKDITNIAKDQLKEPQTTTKTRSWSYDPNAQGQNLFAALKK